MNITTLCHLLTTIVLTGLAYLARVQTTKKLIRDAQHALHSSSKLFALDSLIYHTSNSQINEYLKSKQTLLDAIGIALHHNSITGT